MLICSQRPDKMSSVNSRHQSEAIGYLLKTAQQSLRRAMDRSLREVGITTPQYAAMTFLDEAPGLSNAQLARRAFVTPQTMNRILVNLEHTGMVVRDPHPELGRVLTTRLSKKGRSVLADCHRRVNQVEHRMLASFTPAEQRQYADLLSRSTRALRPNLRSAPSGDARR